MSFKPARTAFSGDNLRTLRCLNFWTFELANRRGTDNGQSITDKKTDVFEKFSSAFWLLSFKMLDILLVRSNTLFCRNLFLIRIFRITLGITRIFNTHFLLNHCFLASKIITYSKNLRTSKCVTDCYTFNLPKACSQNACSNWVPIFWLLAFELLITLLLSIGNTKGWCWKVLLQIKYILKIQ